MTVFTSFPFTAKAPSSQSITANRTLPDRLGTDIVNVKDWGAKGDGSTDDSAAINAAIVYAYGLEAGVGFCSGGAIVYFPPGTYVLGSRVETGKFSGSFQGCLSLEGAGRNATILTGNINDYLVIRQDRSGQEASLHSIRHLTIQNLNLGASSGGFLYTGMLPNLAAFEHCNFIGINAFNMNSSANFGNTIQNCRFSYPGFSPNAVNFFPASNASPGPISGSTGCFWQQGTLVNCYAEGFDTGFNTVGSFSSAISCRAFRCNHGFSTRGSAVAYMGCATDRCGESVSIQAPNLIGLQIIGHDAKGIDGVTDAAIITNIVNLGGGQVRATTSLAHNLATGQTWLLLVTNPAGWTPNGTGQQFVLCTNSGTNTFDYTLSSPPGSFTNGTWNYPLNYGIRGANVGSTDSLFAANSLRSNTLFASFVDQHSGAPGADIGNAVMATSAPNGIWTPASPDGSNWEFIQCGTVGTAIPYGFLKYSDLTTGVGGSLEGREYNIIDGQKSGGGIATFGDIIVGGNNGTNGHYKVRYNGSNWIRIG